MLPEERLSEVAPTPRRVPEPYLRAEIAAFPLTSEPSFRNCLLELDPQLSAGDPTRELWRECEQQIAQHTGWSLDRLVSARDRGWFGPRSSPQRVPMHQYLKALARSHLEPRAGVTHIEHSSDFSALDAADYYRWLTFTIPEDLLFTALGVEPAPLHVEIDPPLLVRRLLDSGVAEIHQHIGAGMDFPILWASALAAIATSQVKEDELESPGAPFDNGRFLVRWLLAAAIGRCALAEFLIRGGDDDFETFVLKCFQCSQPQTHNAWTPLRRETLAQTLQALASADDTRLPEIEMLRDLYADLHPTALTLDDAPIEDVADLFHRCDPISVRLDLSGKNSGERWWLRSGLAYLGSSSGRTSRRSQVVTNETRDGKLRQDLLFTRIFWQTIRVRCLYYQTVVERPLTGGLLWFVRFYGRLGALRNPLLPILPQVSYEVAGKGRRIRALEWRTSAEDTPVAIGDALFTFLKSCQRILSDDSMRQGFEPEMGLIYHFVKQRDKKHAWIGGTSPAFWANTYAEPDKGVEDVERGRYVRYFAKQCAIARALAELITAVPSTLWIIRGLDIASDELGVPTWVLAPPFRHVLDVAAKVSILPGAAPPLRVTAHVGEDFRHLLEGMRRIYEQVHYILGSASGRLGHAIALGVDPRTWAESVGSVLMPAEERLWDLVWEWRLYTKYRIKPEYAAIAPRGRVEILLNQVRSLTNQIYPGPDGIAIEHLAEAHHLLHRFAVPPYVREPAVSGAADTFTHAARSIGRSSNRDRVNWPDKVGKLLDAYLNDERVFRWGQTSIDVPIHEDEVAALDAVQLGLRRGIAQNGTVIEVNPSSNLLIGDLLDLRNHPILRLFPPVPEQGGPPPVAIAVGSDDPITFSTQLMHEYTLLHQTARAAGYSECAVHDWLEAIRRTGMDARFTLRWRPNATKKVSDLIHELDQYLHLAPQTAV